MRRGRRGSEITDPVNECYGDISLTTVARTVQVLFLFTLGDPSARICLVKLQAILLLSSFSIVAVAAAYGAVLPDACGNDKVSFEIQLQKNPPAPAAPAAGKVQVF